MQVEISSQTIKEHTRGSVSHQSRARKMGEGILSSGLFQSHNTCFFRLLGLQVKINKTKSPKIRKRKTIPMC